MSEMRRALADIVEIRSQIAASTTFRGLGPAGLATTGALALAVALGQSLWPALSTAPLPYLSAWIATAIASAAIIGGEMLRRARRHHSGLADEMIQHAALQFIPIGAAGLGLTLFAALFAPELLWTLPGLWQLLLSLSLLTALRLLPRAVIFAGAWYFLCGFVVLLLASRQHDFSPWAMGIPFAVGQGLLALIVFRASEAGDG